MESGAAGHCLQGLHKACPILAVDESSVPGTTGFCWELFYDLFVADLCLLNKIPF